MRVLTSALEFADEDVREPAHGDVERAGRGSTRSVTRTSSVSAFG